MLQVGGLHPTDERHLFSLCESDASLKYPSTFKGLSACEALMLLKICIVTQCVFLETSLTLKTVIILGQG